MSALLVCPLCARPAGRAVAAFDVFDDVIFGGVATDITSAVFRRVSSLLNTPRVPQRGARVDF
jgi:hypothetical protein